MHPGSKTLIIADMAFNHDRSVDFAIGLVLRMTGCHGRFAVSRLFKHYIGDKRAMRRSVDQVLDWDFQRIILGHGHIVEEGGPDMIREAYDFLRS